MANIHNLAEEILSQVFELSAITSGPRHFLAAALVCRSWRDSAQRALFGFVWWGRDGFEPWLESAGWPRYALRRCGRTLLRPAMLPALVGVRDLEILGVGDTDWEHLTHQSLSGLKTLTLCNLEDFTAEPPIHPDTPPLPFSLTNLRLIYTLPVPGHEPSPSLLQALFASSQTSLVSLSLASYGQDDWSPSLIGVLPLVASSLRDLTLELSPFPAAIPPLLANFASLSTLRLSSRFYRSKPPTESLLLLGRSLPLIPTLTTLVFNVVVATGRPSSGPADSPPFDAVHSFISLPALATIRRIDFPSTTLPTAEAALAVTPGFARECEARPIVLAFKEQWL